MYLKSLELLGFKSFADRTKMEFNRGLTAIVGPNGCGKSNIFDAVSWVLGEQSVKMLRGSKQEDFIFDGTESQKPMGMAEVSLTLAECEKTLGAEYNEIMVTRRVFRSGEGQYFINKTPCRLRDIQRLFMDTGIGTTSYSLMGQGRIDQILSSRPEDRRAVFEEASGITKYKADRREAMRKLEQTESNLLRLADVIKEVKRQIISLQRQAGKAARYKKLHEELRRYDIFAGRKKLSAMDAEMAELRSGMEAAESVIASMQKEIEAVEKKFAVLREQAAANEARESAARQKETELRAEIERLRQQLSVNCNRIEEIGTLRARDMAEIKSAEAKMSQHKSGLAETAERLAAARAELAKAEAELAAREKEASAHKTAVERSRTALDELHAEAVALESRLTNCLNAIQKMEHEERSAAINRERLNAEHGTLKRTLETQQNRMRKMEKTIEELETASRAAETECAGITEQIRQLDAEAETAKKAAAERHAALAADKAREDLLKQSNSAGEKLPEPVRALLAGQERRFLGALAELVQPPPELRHALEAVLRERLDAIVVNGAELAFDTFLRLAENKTPARLISLPDSAEAQHETPEPPPGFERLADKVSCRPEAAPLLRHLLAGVFLAPSVADIPRRIPAGIVYVSRDGAMAASDGLLESAPDSGSGATLLARRMLLEELKTRIAAAEADLAAAQQRLDGLSAKKMELSEKLAQAEPRMAEAHSRLAQTQGEKKALERDLKQSQDRLETVEWELQNLKQQADFLERKSALAAESDEIKARRAEVRGDVERRNKELEEARAAHEQAFAALMNAREQVNSCRQQIQHLLEQESVLRARLKEQEELAADRLSRLQTYETETAKLRDSSVEIEKLIPALETETGRSAEAAREEHLKKESAAKEMRTLEEKLKSLRKSIEEQQAKKSENALRDTELRVKRQNLLDRLCSEYRIPADAVQTEPPPEWETEPDMETLENTVNEMRARLDAMGPVNLVAIEEHRELEERYEFYNRQVRDLVNSKQQLMEMIRKINKQTSEMFSTAFAAINENFNVLFRKMFGGGTAKLVLSDEEDLLECGIEIIASPPGKRLQNISLLSGGERTMTAVALLFAIYMVKPSPFCVLDEIDAALDESNINRFVDILKDFLAQSQFIVITHNPKTISAADVIYGVTMEETKVSRLVSMKFSKEKPAPQQETAVAQQAPASEPENPASG